MLKGGATEASIQAMMDGNARLEQGIEELREKYALKAEADARAAEAAAQEKRTADALACAACAEKERLDPTVSMVMEDPEAEALRQSRMAALKARASAAKKHLEDGGGELREIVEDDFLKEVRPRAPARNPPPLRPSPAPPLFSSRAPQRPPPPPPPRRARSPPKRTSWCTCSTTSL
jgi:hypothetical protein